MKILALGDPHGKLPENLNSIINKNKIDIIICVGDIAFIPEKPWIQESWEGISDRFMNKNYKEVVDKICSYRIPVLSLRGNMFMKQKKKIADRILRKNKNLINKFTGKYPLQNQNFIFFDVLTEEHNRHNPQNEKKRTFILKSNLQKNLRREKRLNKMLKENPNSILITHNPPYGVVDKAYNGKHGGSKIILNAIKKYQPKLVLCGHIHEAKGKGKIGKTPVYNLGWHGNYVVFDVGEKAKLIESNFLK